MAAEGDHFSISGRLRRGGEEEALRVTWSREEGRLFTRGEKAISFREASRLAPAVFLAPEHRELVTGGPAMRRRFLDRLVLGSRPAAGDDLMRYERALVERNALLSRSRRRGIAPGELDAWTEELVRGGVAVRRHRRAALAHWLSDFEPLARDAGPEYAALRVDYRFVGETEEELRSQFERLAAVERRRGHSMAGPHRDDLVFTRHDRPFVGQASAGELHRAVSLIKLAEWHAVRRATGEAPLFCVDEFDAGLSEGWAEAFVRSLPEGATVLLTSAADPGRWRGFVGGVLEMRAGRVIDRPRAVNEA
jgi:DNA replication and repair protein RecF